METLLDSNLKQWRLVYDFINMKWTSTNLENMNFHKLPWEGLLHKRNYGYTVSKKIKYNSKEAMKMELW